MKPAKWSAAVILLAAGCAAALHYSGPGRTPQESPHSHGSFGSIPHDPVFAMPATSSLSVPILLALLDNPVKLKWFNGHRIPTSWGNLAIHVDLMPNATFLHMQMAGAKLADDWLAAEPLRSIDIEVAAAITQRRIFGTLRAGTTRTQFVATWNSKGIHGQFELSPVSMHDILSLFGGQIPEAEHLNIHGVISARGTFNWPEGGLRLDPEIYGLSVSGLDPHPLTHGTFTVQSRISGEGTPEWVPLRKMGGYIPEAVIAAEDMRFMRHPGYDLDEVQAAFNGTGLQGGPPRGASTLTQQLAKNLFLSSERTVARKLRELIYAVALEQTIGKRRILELYLNVADWGPGVYGIGPAARKYFGKRPEELLPEEAAWLAGILRNPHRAWAEQYATAQVDYSRRNWVLDHMLKLNNQARNTAKTATLSLARPVLTAQPGPITPDLALNEQNRP